MRGKAKKRQGKRNTEQWKALKYPGLGHYQVSNRGRFRKVVGKNRYRLSYPNAISTGNYNLRVKVYYDTGKESHLILKTIVADHWLRPRTGALLTYLDGNARNCDVRNLREKGVKRYKNQRMIPDLLVKVRAFLAEDSDWGSQKRACKLFDLNKSTVSLIARGDRYYDNKNSV
jgi:hypothetical protein